jgi:hypothetical protein
MGVCSALTTLIDSEQLVDKFWGKTEIVDVTELLVLKAVAGY